MLETWLGAITINNPATTGSVASTGRWGGGVVGLGGVLGWGLWGGFVCDVWEYVFKGQRVNSTHKLSSVADHKF